MGIFGTFVELTEMLGNKPGIIKIDFSIVDKKTHCTIILAKIIKFIGIKFNPLKELFLDNIYR